MLQAFSNWLVFDVMSLEHGSMMADVMVYFVYDFIKILLMLFSMIFAVGVLRTYLQQEKIEQWLIKRGIWGNVMAALLGAVTPFCSCSSIPIFLSFVRTGIPLGVMLSFLVTSPVVNEYLVVLMLGTFGWKITLLYVLSGLMIGIVTGLILGRMRLEQYLVTDMKPEGTQKSSSRAYTLQARVDFGFKEAVSIVRKLWVWILVGVGIGAFVHNYVPQSAIQSILSKTGVFSVPIATILGVPIYGSCAAIVPIAVVLFEKGVPLGTALSFMMAVSALSLPEAVMLRRAMQLKLIVIFFAITTLAIIVTGYLFNMLQSVLI